MSNASWRGTKTQNCSEPLFFFLVPKTPREDFFRKVLPQNVFLVFSCLAARPVKAHIALPMRKNSWRITDPFWRRVILDIRNRHMLRLHAHPPRQTPSAQRKRFSTRCICTQTLWGDLLCFARRGVVVYCEETLLGLDLWWGFFSGIFQGFFCGKTAQKIRTPKSAQDITNSAKTSAPQNPRKNSAPKNRTTKSAPKSPHEKSTPTCPCKSPKHPHEWNKLQQTSTREGCEQRAPHGVLSMMLGDGHASSIQTTRS